MTGAASDEAGRFAGRVVVVTGAARNIGYAIAAAFLRDGAGVAVLDIDAAAADRAAATLDQGGRRVAGVHCDVADEASVAAALAAVVARFGRLDVVVNNAGICTLALAVDLASRDWDRVLAVNLKGPWLMAKHAAPHLGEGGAIVNIASQAAQRAQKFTCHYAAAKMGVIGLTRALAVEFAPRIRVNAVSPGTVVNDLIDQEVDWRIARGHDADRDAVLRQWLERIPMGRFQPAAAVAEGVLFLASPAAGEITGETLNISGGAVMV